MNMAIPNGVREMRRRRPSSLEGGTRVRLADQLRIESDALGRGSLWHVWLEQVKWLDEDAPPNDERLLAIAHRMAHGLDLRAEIASFRRLLAGAKIREVLCRKTYAEPAKLGFSAATCKLLTSTPHQLKLFRERRIAVREGDQITSGSIDRLVLWTDATGKALAVDLIDFKTDRLNDPLIVENRVAFYRPQLEAYRDALGKLFKLPTAQICTRLVFLELDVVRTVFAAE
jgi:ATP-dependent helicase/nuclease subunit A